MTVATSLGSTPRVENLAELQRSSGSVRISFKRRNADSVLQNLYQQGCFKVRFPRDGPNPAAEAVLVNTAGGLTDGDRLDSKIELGPLTSVTLTTQAAERIYRSRASPATVANVITIGADAYARWIPQETILFDGARLERSTDIHVESGAAVIAVESTVFGRHAMGESEIRGMLSDRLRLSIDGTLIFADYIRLEEGREGGVTRRLQRPCLGNGATAIATLIYSGLGDEKLLGAIRRLLASRRVTAGASTVGPVTVVRVLTDSGEQLRAAIVGVVEAIRGATGTVDGKRHFSLPRVWSC